MKKITLTLSLFILLLQFSYAQTNTFPSSGNVGIGTIAPAATLDVNGTIAVKGAVVNDTQTISVPADGTYVIASSWRVKGTYTLSFEAANRVQTVTLLVNGNQYDVYSSISVLCDNSYNASAVMSNYRFIFNSDHSVIYLVFDVANRNGGTSVTAHFDGMGVYPAMWGGTFPSSPSATGIYPLTVNMGNVSIGTPNSNGYKLAVKGNIHAQQVTIDQTGWADYVFKRGYHLPNLADVKTYIDQNHHLPEIPSEKDLEKDGLNLGEMNKLLVKKVEELTLYLIEKDKQLKEQQAEINQLKVNSGADQEKNDIALLKEQVQQLMKQINKN